MKQPNRINIRKTGPQQIENFMSELSNFDWDTSTNNNFERNSEQVFDKFFDNFSKLQEKCFPTISVCNNKHKYPRNEWITPGLLQSIKYHDKLYAKLKKLRLTNPLYNTKLSKLKQFNISQEKASMLLKGLFIVVNLINIKVI